MEHLLPREAAFDLFQRSWRRIERSLRHASTMPAETPVPHLSWTLGDLAVHLVQAVEIAFEMTKGEPSPYAEFERIAEINDRLLAERSDRHLPALAEEFGDAAQRMEQRFLEMPDDFQVPFHAGMRFSPPQAMAMMSTEMLVHGWDLSQVTGEAFVIDPADARLMIYPLASIMPNVIDRDAARDFTATYELRLRGGATFRLHFQDGELSVSEVAPGGPADCRFSVDASAFLLMGYGRGSQITPILTGKVLAWGRKPWLAAKFTSLVKNP